MSGSGTGSTKFCTACGAATEPGGRFCPTCGAAITPSTGDPSNEGPVHGEIRSPETPPTGVPRIEQVSSGRGGVGPLPPPTIASRPPKRSKRLGVVVAIVAVVVLGGVAAALTTVLKAKGPSSSTGTNHPVTATGGSYPSFEAAYGSLKNSIAEIKTSGCDGNNYVGSGFVIDAHHIVTAAHVVEGSQTMTVTVANNPIPAQIVGLDQSGDLALVHSATTLSGPYIPLGTQDPQVGQRVAAIGYPLGGGLTMTQGSVSALNQDITVNNINLTGLVQTDTALNPGNSGGPLIGLDGRARGIIDALNTQANATGYALAPTFASSEVNHWIASPESHPLPLCDNANPLQTPAASPAAPSGPSGSQASAASALAAILQQSASARSTVVSATQAVTNCSADPASEISQMKAAIAQRQSALQELSQISPSDLPDGAALGTDITTALNASNQADQSYILWMGDIEGGTCPHPTDSDPNFANAAGASTQATAAKKAVLALWNPLAQQYGLPQYTADQI